MDMIKNLFKLPTPGVISIAALFAISIVAQVFWADWIIQTIFNKDINNWLVLASLCIIALVTPNAMRGLAFLVMVVSTLYIWILM
jgi:hypothetical protein